jgi:hypothetical protein
VVRPFTTLESDRRRFGGGAGDGVRESDSGAAGRLLERPRAGAFAGFLVEAFAATFVAAGFGVGFVEAVRVDRRGGIVFARGMTIEYVEQSIGMV